MVHSPAAGGFREPPLSIHLSKPILAPLVQMKGLFSKRPHLKPLSAFQSGLVVYQLGALLAHARGAQMETLANLLAPGQERALCDGIIEEIKRQGDGYGHLPKNFLDFFASAAAEQFASYQNLEFIERLRKEQGRRAWTQAIDYPASLAAPKTVPTSIGSSIPRCIPLRYAIWPPCWFSSQTIC